MTEDELIRNEAIFKKFQDCKRVLDRTDAGGAVGSQQLGDDGSLHQAPESAGSG